MLSCFSFFFFSPPRMHRFVSGVSRARASTDAARCKKRCHCARDSEPVQVIPAARGGKIHIATQCSFFCLSLSLLSICFPPYFSASFSLLCAFVFSFAGLLQGARTCVCVCLHLHASSQILEHVCFFPLSFSPFFLFLMLRELIEGRWPWVRSMNQLSFLEDGLLASCRSF